ncbi:MAG TPA: Rho termination factor N-terminal domain-containing protein, partial [Streptosporangiaceae bacterium]|nr:Rho termination factor N-terminal domain-containing protein [Streptosporangiaceae bacterium]
MSSEPTDLFTGSPAAPAGTPTQPDNPDLQPAATAAGPTDPVTRDRAAPAEGGSGPARAAGPDAEPAGGQADRGANTGLSAMLLPELQRMAQSMGITGTARMRKSQLVEAIQNRQGGQTAAPHATRRGAELDNSAQRVASAGADAPRHREQDDMEPDRTTQQGLGEGTYPAASGWEAPASAPQEGAAGGGGADSQLAFEQPGTAGQGTATDAAPVAPGAPGGTGTAGPAGDEQRGDAQRGDAQDGDAQRADGHQGGDGQRGDRRRRNNGRRDDQARGGEAAEQRQDQGGQRGGQAGQQDQGGRGDDDSEGRGGRRNRDRFRNRNRRRGERGGEAEPVITEDDVLIPIAGILDVLDNYAFIRTTGYLPGSNDVYVSLSQVRKHGLRKGDVIEGAVRQPREGERREKFNALVRLDKINGLDPEESRARPEFAKLVPLYPQERLRLET